MRKSKQLTKQKLSSDKFTNRLEKFSFVERVSKDNADELSNASEKEVGFGSGGGKRTSVSESEIVFEDIDSALNVCSVLVKIVPMLSAARNAGVKA